MKHQIMKVVAFVAAAFLFSTALSMGAAAFAGNKPTKDNDKVGICHRTNSDTNPFTYIEVPQDEANGHISGTDKSHNDQGRWKSDGTFRRVEHKAGDEKHDYFATQQSDCEDTSSLPPTENPCPNGDFNGAAEGCGTPPVVCVPEDYNGNEDGCGTPPVVCTPDYNGDDEGCGTPPTTEVPCPEGDHSGDAEGCDSPVGVETCDDFSSQPAAQHAFDSDPEAYASLDADGDGVACESNPTPTPDPVLNQAPTFEPGPVPTTQPVIPTVVHAGMEGLPNTGGPNWMLFGLGAVIFASGIGLTVLGKRLTK